jgi:hypothetical protein
MTHPITLLQGALVAALREELEPAVFDAPPRESVPPYIAIARHDVLPRNGDIAPGYEHRVLLHVWAADASRKAAVAIAEEAVEIALDVASSDLTVTHSRHDRTDTAIDSSTGRARAAISLTFFTEPN